MHIVELQYGNDAAAKIIATMRKWLDLGKAQPTIRYSLLGTATVLRVDFELEGSPCLCAGIRWDGPPVTAKSAQRRGHAFADNRSLASTHRGCSWYRLARI